MKPIVTRQAILADLESVVPMFDAYRQFYQQASDLAAARTFLRDKFNHGQSEIFLAWDGNAPVGFTQLYPCFSSVSMARTFVLNDLFVAPSHRRLGVGALLLQAAEAHGQALGAVRLSLTTTTLPLLSVMSKRATSPRKRSATNSICAPLSIKRKLSLTKKLARMASGVRPMALSRIVTGILRRRSTRKYKMSFGSNS